MKIHPDIAQILGLTQIHEAAPAIHAYAERSAEQQAHDRREFLLWIGGLFVFIVALAVSAEALGL